MENKAKNSKQNAKWELWTGYIDSTYELKHTSMSLSLCGASNAIAVSMLLLPIAFDAYSKWHSADCQSNIICTRVCNQANTLVNDGLKSIPVRPLAVVCCLLSLYYQLAVVAFTFSSLTYNYFIFFRQL